MTQVEQEENLEVTPPETEVEVTESDTIEAFTYVEQEPDEVEKLKTELDGYKKLVDEDPIISQLVAARQLGEDEFKVLNELKPKDFTSLLKSDPKSVFVAAQKMKYPLADEEVLEALYKKNIEYDDDDNEVLKPEFKLELTNMAQELTANSKKATDYKSKVSQMREDLSKQAAEQTDAWVKRVSNKKIFSSEDGQTGYKVTDSDVEGVKKIAQAVFSGKMPLEKVYDMILVATKAHDIVKVVPKSVSDKAKADILGEVANVERKSGGSNVRPPATEKVDLAAEARKRGEAIFESKNPVKKRF